MSTPTATTRLNLSFSNGNGGPGTANSIQLPPVMALDMDGERRTNHGVKQPHSSSPPQTHAESNLAKQLLLPFVGASVFILVVLCISFLSHNVVVRKAHLHGVYNTSVHAELKSIASTLHTQVTAWKQRIVGAGNPWCKFKVVGVVGDSDTSLRCDNHFLEIPREFVLRYAQNDGIVLQHAQGATLTTVASFNVLEQSLTEPAGTPTQAGLIRMRVDHLTDPTAFLDIIFVSDSFGRNACKIDTSSPVGTRTTLALILVFIELIVLVSAVAFVYRAGVVSIASRLFRYQEVSNAATTLDLNMLAILRIADGEAMQNIRSCMMSREVYEIDRCISGVISRLTDVRKHLPQIVLNTKGSLVDLLTAQAVEAGVDAKELAFGSSAMASGSRELSSSGGSPPLSPRSERGGQSHSGANSPKSFLEMAGPLMVSYDVQNAGENNQFSPDASPGRNPLLPLESVVNPIQDFNCFMLLKKATFVVCKLFFSSVDLHLASFEKLQKLHSIAQSFYSVVSSCAQQFDGIVHSHKLNEIVLVWNAFRPYPFHETRGALCALHIASQMNHFEESQQVKAEGIKWCLVVNTGAAVVSQSGSAKKVTASIVGDSIVMAAKVAELGRALQAGVVVMEHTHVVARNQLFSIPIDVIGDENWKITLFEMKGKQEEYRQKSEYHGMIDGFSLMLRHKFEEAQNKLFACSQVELQAKRLRNMCHMFQQIPGVQQMLPNPYHRQVPGWDFKEMAADELDVRAEIGLTTGSNETCEMLSPSASVLSIRPRSRRPSILPQEFLRAEIQAQGEVNENFEPPMLESPMMTSPGSVDGGGIAGGGEGGFVFPTSPHQRGIEQGSIKSDGSLNNSFHSAPFLSPPPSAPSSARLPPALEVERLSQERVDLDATPAITLNAPPAPAGRSSGLTISFPEENAMASASHSPMRTLQRSSSRTSLLNASTASMVENDPNAFVDRKGFVWKVGDRKLGEGSFGAVFVGLAEDGELVAIKQLPLPDHSATDEERSRREKEIEDVLEEVGTLSALRDEHIVRYYSSAIHNSKLCIVMEFIGGGSLSQLLNRFGALPSLSIQRYARDILTGLKFLHAKGIVHRDVNPNNVLMTVDGGCKLSDFGASKSITKLSQESDICGTPPFMAPEQCRGNASTASDIWGFGIMMCVMFKGKLPYDSRELCNIEMFLKTLANDAFFGPSIPGPPITSETELDFISQCLERDAEQRITAEQLLSHPFFMN